MARRGNWTTTISITLLVSDASCRLPWCFSSSSLAGSSWLAAARKQTPSKGKWQGVTGEQDLSWTLVRTGDTTYKIDRGSDDRIALVTASDGALNGRTELDLGKSGVATVQLRITSTGPDSLKQEMTLFSQGEKIGPATSMDLIRRALLTPSALASSFAPSQDDLAYMNDVRLGMEQLDKSVSLVGQALKAKSPGEARRKFRTSFTLTMQLARKWRSHPAPSKQLEPLSKAWNYAFVYGTSYVYETAKVYVNLSQGKEAGLDPF